MSNQAACFCGAAGLARRWKEAGCGQDGPPRKAARGKQHTPHRGRSRFLRPVPGLTRPARGSQCWRTGLCSCVLRTWAAAESSRPAKNSKGCNTKRVTNGEKPAGVDTSVDAARMSACATRPLQRSKKLKRCLKTGKAGTRQETVYVAE